MDHAAGGRNPAQRKDQSIARSRDTLEKIYHDVKELSGEEERTRQGDKELDLWITPQAGRNNVRDKLDLWITPQAGEIPGAQQATRCLYYMTPT